MQVQDSCQLQVIQLNETFSSLIIIMCYSSCAIYSVLFIMRFKDCFVDDHSTKNEKILLSVSC